MKIINIKRLVIGAIILVAALLLMHSPALAQTNSQSNYTFALGRHVNLDVQTSVVGSVTNAIEDGFSTLTGRRGMMLFFTCAALALLAFAAGLGYASLCFVVGAGFILVLNVPLLLLVALPGLWYFRRKLFWNSEREDEEEIDEDDHRAIRERNMRRTREAMNQLTAPIETASPGSMPRLNRPL